MKRGEMRAFSGQVVDDDGTTWIHPGLTVREYFAAAALTGILSNPSIDGSGAQCAEDAVRCADNLLAELEEGDEDEEADQDEVVAP